MKIYIIEEHVGFGVKNVKAKMQPKAFTNLQYAQILLNALSEKHEGESTFSLIEIDVFDGGDVFDAESFKREILEEVDEKIGYAIDGQDM
jgi:hypothetical protein